MAATVRNNTAQPLVMDDGRTVPASPGTLTGVDETKPPQASYITQGKLTVVSTGPGPDPDPVFNTVKAPASSDATKILQSRGDGSSYGQWVPAPSGGSGGGIKYVAAGNLGAAYTLNLSTSTEDLVVLEGTLNASCTITVSNRRKCIVRLLLAQDATGYRTLTISDGTSTQVLTITTTPNAVSRVDLTLPDATAIYFDAPVGASVPPVNVAAPAVTGTATVGSTLTCSTGTWSNSPTSYTYQWKRGAAAISGATSSTYTLVSADGGSAIKCTVTATNTAGSVSQDSNSVNPPVVAPTNTVAPAVTGSTYTGAVLTSSTGTWTGSPTGYTYQWKRNGTAISGATSSTYTLVSADEGTSVKCTVTATNAGGSASQDSNAISAVAFDPAAISGMLSWYKADAITPVADGTPLASWVDSSGNGHTLLQATGANQPLYKTNVQNTKPAVRSDGVNDLMAAAYTVGTTATTFVVARYLTAYSATAAILDGNTGFKNNISRTSSTAIQLYNGGGIAVTTTPEAIHVYVSVLAATSSIAADANTPTSLFNAATESGGLTIGAAGGGSQFANADIFEVIQYSGNLSSGDRALVLGYLKNKWGTP